MNIELSDEEVKILIAGLHDRRDTLIEASRLELSGDGRQTLFAMVAATEELRRRLHQDSKSRRPPGPDDIDEFVARFGGGTQAILAVSNRLGVAVAWIDRDTVEGHLDRTLTTEEWAALALHFDSSYDEWVGDGDTQGEFIDQAVIDAGIADRDGITETTTPTEAVWSRRTDEEDVETRVSWLRGEQQLRVAWISPKKPMGKNTRDQLYAHAKAIGDASAHSPTTDQPRDDQTRYYRTVYQVEVLSNEPFDAGAVREDLSDLEAIAWAINEGACSGMVTEIIAEEVDLPRMSELLIAQGSDPSFLITDQEEDTHV